VRETEPRADQRRQASALPHVSAGFNGVLSADFSAGRAGRAAGSASDETHPSRERTAVREIRPLWLLRQNPLHQLLELLIAQVAPRPHDEAIAPMTRAPSADNVGQPLAILRIAPVVLRYSGERWPDVRTAERVAIEASFLFSQFQAAIEILARVRQRKKWKSECERACRNSHVTSLSGSVTESITCSVCRKSLSKARFSGRDSPFSIRLGLVGLPRSDSSPY
jgi:hypothetical protein